jgi:protoporphyrinogen oxidase
MRVGVVGGGLMGLAVAHRLAAGGHRVTVYERAPQLGGLTTWHDFGAFVWDRFYHVILPTDTHTIRFVQGIGLGDRLRWAETKTGYYVDGRFHGLSNTAEFVRFPPLSLWSKLRLAATIVLGARIEDWHALERVPLEDWLVRYSGRSTFEKFWKPLLLAKLGESYRRTSAVFIWSYIKRLYSARDASAKKEHMGYVAGGYRTVFERLESDIRARGGEVRLPVQVRRIAPAGAGVSIATDAGTEAFDKVVFTGPVNVLREVAGAELVAVPGGGADVEYLGVVCMVLVTRQPLTPYYVLNLADENVPFTGVIGMSSIVDLAETAGRHLTYLPKYVLSSDPLLKAGEEEIRARFLAGLQRLYPRFPLDAIESVHIHRASRVQPLQVLDYSSLVPRPQTRHPDFYVLNTAQFVANTLNNNEVIRTVEEFFERHGADFAAPGR